MIFTLEVGPSFNELGHGFEQGPLLLLGRVEHAILVLIAKNNKLAILLEGPGLGHFEERPGRGRVGGDEKGARFRLGGGFSAEASAGTRE